MAAKKANKVNANKKTETTTMKKGTKTDATAAAEERAEQVEALEGLTPEARAEAVEALEPAAPADATDAQPAPEASESKPEGAATEDAVEILRGLGFERSGKEAEEVRYADLVATAKQCRDATSEADRREAEGTLAQAGWFRQPAEPKVVRQYEVLGTPQGIALRPTPVTDDAGAPVAPAPTAPDAPAANLDDLRTAVERAEAQVASAEEEAKRIVSQAKAAARAAAGAYRDACKTAGRQAEHVGGGRGSNVSERVTFEVALAGDSVRIAVKGRPESEDLVPIETVRASINKAAYAYTDKHLGPREVIGNKGGSLSNRLRALLGAGAGA